MEGGSDPLNVLVLDDDQDTRNLLLDVVSRHGQEVVLAASAEEALELLPFWTFQVALLDHNLPGIEGLVVGEFFRRNNPDMMIALVTGEVDTRLEKRTRDLGIRFIRKPFAIAEVVSLLDDYRALADERQAERLRRTDPAFAPVFRGQIADLGECYGITGVSERVATKLAATIRRCLHDLRAVSRYTERDRVLALSGLLAARVLGVELPRTPGGATLFEEYDAIMRARGRRTEFSDE